MCGRSSGGAAENHCYRQVCVSVMETQRDNMGKLYVCVCVCLCVCACVCVLSTVSKDPGWNRFIHHSHNVVGLESNL